MNQSNNVKEEMEKLRSENRQLLEQVELLNRKLVESEEFKSHFLSNVTNEIVNPFASVIGLSEQIMKLNQKECSQAVALAAHIYEEAASLDFQLRNIFVAARLEAGEEMPEPSRINLNELLEKVTGKTKHQAARKQISFTVDTDDACHTFVSDEKKLELIILNLLYNAVNFTDEGKNVQLRLECQPDTLVVQVRDEGIGMTEEEKKRIFDRFHRANPRIQSVSPGSGLGLAVVEGLLFLLEGKIEVDTAPGKGTTVKVTVPQMDPAKIEFEDDLFFDDEPGSEESF